MLDLFKLHSLIDKIGRCTFTGRLVCVDPGETTGVSVFEHTKSSTSLVYADQLKTWPIEFGVAAFANVLSQYAPNFLVYESYHIYDWKLQQHSFADVPTLQLIGALRTLCIQRNVPYDSQSAQIGKGFATDDKLKTWGLHIPGQVHSRDSIRHGCQYLLFGITRKAQ